MSSRKNTNNHIFDYTEYGILDSKLKVITVDNYGKIAAISNGFLTHFKIKSSDIVKNNIFKLSLISVSKNKRADYFEKALQLKSIELCLLIKNKKIWLEINVLKIKSKGKANLFYTLFCEDITIQKTLLLKESTKNNKIEKLTNVLLAITKNEHIQLGHINEALELITRTTSEFLSIPRVSVWTYSYKKNNIECIKLWEAQNSLYSEGAIINASDYPTYFNALLEEKIIIAPQAQKNTKTKEFTEHYLKPLNIKSLLDVPFFVDGELSGIICSEHTYTIRKWDVVDILFTKGIADLISLCYKANLRQKAEAKIKKQKQEIAAQNIKLKENQITIQKYNKNLEQIIERRTAELVFQNKQLSEYAYINAHLLRGPLSRIQGLIQLLEKERIDDSTKDLLQMLLTSAIELDTVVKKITQAIKVGEHFTRDKIRE